MKTVKLHIQGMHCKACVTLIQGRLSELDYVTDAKVSLENEHAIVTGDFQDKNDEILAKEWSLLVSDAGYSMSVEKKKSKIEWQDFYYALPVAALIILLFAALQKLGIINLIGGSDLNYGTAVLIGLVASVSTCMAVVGGLVLSMSASYAKEGEAIKPQLYFHISRLVAFFVLGGIIGTLGSFLRLNLLAASILSILVALVLLVLGLNLLDITKWTRKFQFTLPASFGTKVKNLSSYNHTLTPVALGIATFILPCGFTQSMQLYALSTGSFFSGALTMFMFALGTLPVLAILSFSSFTVSDNKWKGVFFKTAGLVVIFFGIYNLTNALAVLGYIPFIFNF